MTKTSTGILAFIILICGVLRTEAQIWKKLPGFSDKPNNDSIAQSRQLRTDLLNIANDNTGIRKMGSDGEKKAAEFVGIRMSQLGLRPLINNNYKQVFKLATAKRISYDTRLKINNAALYIPTDAVPFPFSKVGSDEFYGLPGSKEPENIWILPLFHSAGQATSKNFDAEQAAYTQALYAMSRGARGIILYDEYGSSFMPSTSSTLKTLDIPVWYITKKGYDTYIRNWSDIQQVSIIQKYEEVIQYGWNICAMLNNNANSSIVICAHYDNNETTEKGAKSTGMNDNATGVAVMLALAKKIKDAGLNNYNYIFVALTGNGDGRFGAASFASLPALKTQNINGVINLDKLGHFDNIHKVLTVEGSESALQWKDIFKDAHLVSNLQFQNADSTTSLISAFWEQQLPAVTLLTNNKAKETEADDIATINIKGIGTLTEEIFRIISTMNRKGHMTFNNDL